MSTLKKLLALTLALAMVLSVSVFAANYSEDVYADAADIHEDCKDAVELMYALEIMQGTGANFEPNAPITRAQMAKIIYVIMNGGKDDKAVNYVGNSIFSDVPAAEWYNGYVNYCAMTKKIQGYDGKFDPNGTLTVSAAAKMLLTAIGYDAEAYGFVGPNWENNVLTVAHEAGLLTDVATNLTGAAPRQWVAKMVENSLGAYCYENVAAIPGNAILGNYWFGNAGDKTQNITTFGEKFLKLSYVESVAMATKKTSLYTTAKFSTNGILFADGSDLKGTGLTVEDLGQEFKVILKKGDVISVRNTGVSVVAEALTRDVSAKTNPGVTSNKEGNKYVYTIGDMAATFEDASIARVVLGKVAEKVNAKAYTSDNFYKVANANKNLPTVVKAIDADGDDKIDYLVETEYAYAQVASTGTSRTYGDFITLKNMNTDAPILADGATQSRWYLDQVVNCDEELAEGYIVKYNYNVETAVYDIEVLEAYEATLERRYTTKDGVCVLDGEEYVKSQAATAVLDSLTTYLTKAYEDETLIIAADGDMLVAISTPEDAALTLADVNAKLAVVLDKTDHYAPHADYVWDYVDGVKLLTFDGEIMGELGTATGAVAYADVNVIGNHGDACAPDSYLYAYKVDDDGVITLYPATVANLDKNKNAIQTTWTGDLGDWKVANRVGNDTFALENEFFVAKGSGSKFTVEVKTLEELEGLKAVDAHLEGLYTTKAYGTASLSTVVGGLIMADAFEGSATEGDGYAFVLDAWSEDGDDYAELLFADDTTEVVELSASSAAAKKYTLYTFESSDDVYTLKNVAGRQYDHTFSVKAANENVVSKFEDKTPATKELVVEFLGDKIYVDNASTLELLDLTDCTIAVKYVNMELNEDENRVEVEQEVEFTTLEDLKEIETIFNETEIDDDVYYSDFAYKAEGHFYVIIYRVPNNCQPLLP